MSLLFQRLTKELEEWSRQKQQLAKTPKEYKIPSYPTEKHLEERLKVSFISPVHLETQSLERYLILESEMARGFS